MGSTPIPIMALKELRDMYEVRNIEVRKLGFKPKRKCL